MTTWASKKVLNTENAVFIYRDVLENALMSLFLHHEKCVSRKNYKDIDYDSVRLIIVDEASYDCGIIDDILDECQEAENTNVVIMLLG